MFIRMHIPESVKPVYVEWEPELVSLSLPARKPGVTDTIRDEFLSMHYEGHMGRDEHRKTFHYFYDEDHIAHFVPNGD